jgi:hypothetical protein
MGLLSLFLALIDKFLCKNEGGVLSLSQCRICSILTEDSLFRCEHLFFEYSVVDLSHSITESKKRTWVYRERISTRLLYFFIIRELFLEGKSQSSTAFSTVYF